jgi:hypothetical protein
MNPPHSSIEAAKPNSPSPLKTFCTPTRSLITRSIHTQSALFASIQALAAQAIDGVSDQQAALLRIDLLAARAAEDSENLANAIGTIPTATER